MTLVQRGGRYFERRGMPRRAYADAWRGPVFRRSRAGLPRWVINVHGLQVFHLVSGEAEMDKQSPDLRHSADRDSHFLAAPHMPLLEEHVGYPVAARFHD